MLYLQQLWKYLEVSKYYFLSFPGDSVLKDLPANAGDPGDSLSQEDPLEKEMATHSGTIAWKIPSVSRIIKSNSYYKEKGMFSPISPDTQFLSRGNYHLSNFFCIFLALL